METISLKGVDERLLKNLKAMARKRAISVNKVIVEVLKESVYVEKEMRQKPYPKHHDLDHLFGTWKDDSGTKEIEEILSAQRKIDKELWK